MKQKFLSFDIEQAEPFPESGQITDYAGLGITCAALGRSDRILEGQLAGDPFGPVLIFYAGMYDQVFNGRMNGLEIGELIEALLEEARLGYKPLTWNGASYDFRMLAEAAPEYREAIRDHLVLGGYDMMFHFFSCKGYFLGLDKACQGQGIEGKILDSVGGEKMNGEKAVAYWPEHAELVLRYVSQDVIAPVLLANQITHQNGLINWVSNSGRPTSANLNVVALVKYNVYEIPQCAAGFRWLTVQECLNLPPVDQSWMSDPVSKEEFLSYWL